MATYYVRTGATGTNDGSDWTNAWHDFDHIVWGSIVGDDIIYIAGGTYVQNLAPAASGSDGHPILIYRATIDVHGTETGWNASYDAQVVLNQKVITISGPTVDTGYNYITIDGKTWEGIRVDKTGGTAGHIVDLSPSNKYPKIGITLRYIEAEGPGRDSGIDNTACFRNTPIAAADPANSAITLQYCHFHETATALMKLQNCTNFLMEYCEVHGTEDATLHEDFIICYNNTNAIIRYNLFYDTESEGIYLEEGNTGFEIYGNVIYQTGALVGIGTGIGVGGGHTITGFKVYNNTTVGFLRGFEMPEDLNSVEAYNNLFYNNTSHWMSTIGSGVTHDYNWYYPAEGTGGDNGESNGQTGTGDPFSGSTAFDFFLVAATLSGITLTSPYNQDLTGKTRGHDGTWDRGAYEYVLASLIMVRK